MSPRAANSIDAFVAGRLRTCRKQLGLSQSEIAKQLGVTFQQIQKYEAGLNRIGAGRLFQLAALYGIPIQELFPRYDGTVEGAKRAGQIDQVAGFANSPEGWKLCASYLRIKDARQRRMVLGLIEEMAGEP